MAQAKCIEIGVFVIELIYAVNDSLPKTEDYLDLVQDVWPGSYSFSLTEQALTKTGIGTKLMELAWAEAPTSLFWSAARQRKLL